MEQEQNIEDVIKERDEYLDNWKRAAADFENYKRRKTEEEKELVVFAREYAVVKMLPTLDSLASALSHMPEGVNPEWTSGIEGLVKQLYDALSSLGVQKIEAVGKKFDPHFHEAVREVDGEEDGIVMEEYQTGYIINNKVIRPSQVAISKNIIQKS